MIDRGTIDALARISKRSQDLLQAYRPGFEPGSSDMARTSTPIASPDPLSVAAPEGAYFVTRDRTGTLRYTRDGGFSVTGGELVDRSGVPMLGVASKGTALSPIRLDRFDDVLGRAFAPQIEADGSVVYTRRSVDPRTGWARSERVVAGRLALARFPAGTAPVRVDATHVEAPRGVAPSIGTAVDGTFGKLSTFARDLGRLDLNTGLERLREAYQSFEAMRAAHAARGAVDKTAMDLVK